ncbi:MAG: hypothetical protein NTY73_03750 [Candidatus Micrarchaeota archaeon]|nr:hypothetical protein [Candidatus Micrarchaeota archaeon]
MDATELLKDFKKLMGVAGIVFGGIGIIAVIALYFIVSPILDRAGASIVLSMDHASSAVDSASASLDSASASVSSLSAFSDNASASFQSLEEGSGNFSSAIRSLSAALGSSPVPVPGSSLEQLNNSADSFEQFASHLAGTRSSLSSLSSSTKGLSSNINATIGSMSSTRSDIHDTKESMIRAIAGLKLALLVWTIMMILFFLTLTSYSAGILL